MRGATRIQNFLGFYTDNEITWKYYINQMSSKIAKMTGIIGKARYYLSLIHI